MKKAFSITALILIIGIFFVSIISYNTRPLPFEDQPRENPVETFASGAAENAEKFLNDTSEKLRNFEMPNLSKSEEVEVKIHDLKSGPVVATDYDRSDFGATWKDVDGNGCDTRNDILARDLKKVVKSDSCKVTMGVLNDPYSGETIEHKTGLIDGERYRSEVQIDHVIPLSYAYKQGASNWTEATREAFANDPLNLKAVKGSENMGKSDKGPAEWMPSNSSYHCDYAKDFAKVAVTYDLPVTKADYKVIQTACN